MHNARTLHGWDRARPSHIVVGEYDHMEVGRDDLLDFPVHLARLDFEQRMVEMFYFEDLPIVDIASRCNLMPSSINRRLNRAMEVMMGEDVPVPVKNGRYSRPRLRTAAGFKKISKCFG